MMKIIMGDSGITVEVNSTEEAVNFLTGLGSSSGKHKANVTSEIKLTDIVPTKTKKKKAKSIRRLWTREEREFILRNMDKSARQMQKTPNSPVLARSLQAIETYRWSLRTNRGANKMRGDVQVINLNE